MNKVISNHHINPEIIDLRSLRPLDTDTIIKSVKKTGNIIAMDTSWNTYGTNAEILAVVAENALNNLKSSPKRLGLKDCPTPASSTLAEVYYPNAETLAISIYETLGKSYKKIDMKKFKPEYIDVPDKTFMGPF